MQANYEDQITRAEEEKAALRKKLEEAHATLLKRSHQTDEKVSKLEARLSESEERVEQEHYKKI